MTIVSERSRQPWIGGIAIFVAFLGFAIVLFYGFFKVWNKGEVENKTYMLFVIAAFFIGIVVNLIWSYWFYSRRIVVDKDKIQYHETVYPWHDVTEVILSGKHKFGFFGFRMEATTLVFRDNTKGYIFQDFYANAPQIKSFIKYVILEKSDMPLPIKPQAVYTMAKGEIFWRYSGNPLFSLRGILTWGLIAFIMYCAFGMQSPTGNPDTYNKLLLGLPFCAFWFLLNAFSNYYFEVSDNFLIIKNHYFFWIKEVYKLSDVEQFVYETEPKQANMLRIILADFTQKRYRAGSLTDATWHDMKADFETKGIEVRNECVHPVTPI